MGGRRTTAPVRGARSARGERAMSVPARISVFALVLAAAFAAGPGTGAPRPAAPRRGRDRPGAAVPPGSEGVPLTYPFPVCGIGWAGQRFPADSPARSRSAPSRRAAPAAEEVTRR
ncbi:hypothetical protein GCM10009834_09000 [Streptomonospora arabica]